MAKSFFAEGPWISRVGADFSRTVAASLEPWRTIVR